MAKTTAIVVLRKDEDSAQVHPDGYVDYGSYDGRFKSQEAGVASLKRDGWDVVGYEVVR